MLDLEARLSTASTAALSLTAALLLIPGAVLGTVAGLRWARAVLVGPLVSLGLVAVCSQVASRTGLPWQLSTFVWTSAVAVAVTAGLRWVARSTAAGRRYPWRVPGRGSSVTGSVVGLPVVGTAAAVSLLGTGLAVRGMGGLTAVNQGFDAVFHVNAVTLITETRDADPAAIGAVNFFRHGSSYYPDGFHALASLVAGVGINPVVATNALVALVPAVAVAGLAGLLSGLGLVRHAVVTPFVLVSTAAFPTDLLWRGPIWPFALGLALVPAWLELLRDVLDRRSRGGALVLALGGAGLMLVHPSAALAAGVFAIALVLQRWLTRPSPVRDDLLPLATTALLTVVLSLGAVTAALVNSGYGATYDWPAVQTPGSAVGELLLFNYDAEWPQVWLTVAVVVGLAAVRRVRELRWYFLATAVFAVLFVMAASYEGRWVALLTGPWWNDRYRFVALASLGLVVLAGHGLVVTADLLTRGLRRVLDRRERLAAVAGVVAVLLAFGVVTNGFYADHTQQRMQKQFGLAAGGSVTPAEFEGMQHLATLVRPGEVVVNDPDDGSGWMWALDGVRPMFGQAVLFPVRPPLEPDQATVFTRFNCIDSDPAVRGIVDRYHVRYVFTGNDFIIPGMTRIPGLQELWASDSLHLVWSNSGSRIYEVQATPLVDPSRDLACLLSQKARQVVEDAQG